ncbi:MAG: hypothetical protein ACLRXB_14620 [Escherichia coli]
MKTVSGEKGDIYCLAKHQSTENAFIAFRCQICGGRMQRHFEQHHELSLRSRCCSITESGAVSVQHELAGVFQKSELLANCGSFN